LERPLDGSGASSASRWSIRGRLTYVAALVVLTAVYVATARFGLTLDAVAGFATLVWPASGISLAALVIFGFRSSHWRSASATRWRRSQAPTR
jgi:hypothetical protein